MRLYDIAKIIRSKNAGPFTLTIDLFFADDLAFDTVVNAPAFTPDRIAALYSVPSTDVRIIPFREILAVKISLPRLVSSGSPLDRDVYGAQQHFPLGDIDI